MNEEVRLGLIGCGNNMRNAHTPRLLKNPHVRILALCEPLSDNVKKMVETHPALAGLPVYEDYRRMLDAGGLDAVVISTPHTLHHRQIVDSLQRGLHVLVEKPMVCSVAEAKEVIAARDASGKQVLVSYQRHYAGAWRYCRQFIAEGKLGPIHFVQAYQCQNWWRPGTPSAEAWRRKPDLSGGGQLNDSGSHLIDILLWATQLVPEEVFAYISNQGAQVDVLSAVSLRFRNGAIGNVSVVGQSNRGFDEEVNIWGSEGCLQVLATGRQRLFHHNPQVREVPPEERPDAGDPDTNFVNAILGREEVQSPAEGGLRVIALTEAIWRSAASGRPERCVEV